MKSESTISLDIKTEHTIFENKIGEPSRIYVLLHGYLLDGSYMMKEFSGLFQEGAHIVSPNGPFLVPVKKGEEYFPKYAWYFFDPIKKSYYINYDPGAKYLSDILINLNPKKLPVTIIGYSQGGYLAPRVANFCPEVDQIISIASVFRPDRFDIRSEVEYVQINSESDLVVDFSEAVREGEIMKAQGADYKIELLQEPGHRITNVYKDTVLKFLKN